MRVWFLKESPSICAESSAGCNTLVSSREGEIQRITPRRNDLVNDTWMTDSGRSLHQKVKSSNRILRPTHEKRDVPMADALEAALDLLKGDKIGVVASCNSTLEEQLLLKRIIDSTNASTYIRGHFGEDDGILLSADRTPNLRGALISGLTNEYPADHLENLQKSLDNNELDALLYCW